MAGKKKSFFRAEDSDGQAIRLNRYLSDAGYCSRRAADALIEEGRVYIDGKRATLGTRVSPKSIVKVDGRELKREKRLVLIALNKPVGIVCTTDRREPNNVIDFLKHGQRIYPIGRLDKDSEGLLLLTNNGDIVNKILRSANNHEKEYLVTVNKPIEAGFAKGMSEGVPILGTVTKSCFVEVTGRNSFRIILTQGLNRQIRRMCEYFGYRVTSLKRIRIMNIKLGRLKSGDYRNLTEAELIELRRLIGASENTKQQ